MNNINSSTTNIQRRKLHQTTANIQRRKLQQIKPKPQQTTTQQTTTQQTTTQQTTTQQTNSNPQKTKIPELPLPIIPITINEQITKPKHKSKHKSKPKPTNITYNDLEINFTDENIFGKKFSKRKTHLKCAIDYLTLHQSLNKKGEIKTTQYSVIKKRYIWQYIYYLRINNKNIKMFKTYLGLGHNIKPIHLYKMIKEETNGNLSTKNINKKELNKFLNKLFRKNKNLKIPLLNWYVMMNKRTNKKNIKVIKTNEVNKRKEVNKSINTTLSSEPIRLDIELVSKNGKIKNLTDKSNIDFKIVTELKKITT